jgi:hypothetical protein
MDKTLVEKWVAALRSGEYQQGVGRLRRADNTFCCLGVAYDLLVREGKAPPWYYDSTKATYFIPDWTNFDLPVPYDTLFGIAGSAISQDNLISLNDGGTPFAEIADYIERGVLGHESVTSVSSTESG